MILNDIKRIIRKHKPKLIKKYHVIEIGVFGSFVKNRQTKKSDIDILVDFAKPISLFEFITMEEELSQLLNNKVDLVSKKALKPYIGKYILEETQII